MNRRSRGQALAEFALVAPLFFLLLFAIIETGRFIFYYETLHNATREGARYAIVNGQNSLGSSTGPDTGTSTTSDDPDGSDVVQKVRDSAIGMEPGAITVNRCWWYSVCAFKADPPVAGYGDGNYLRGANVTVHATYTYTTILPLPLPNITVEAESSLVINN
jgi:Flp pilus assembly protein TadG